MQRRCQVNRFKGTPGPWHYQKDADVYTHIVRPDSNTGRIILYGSQSSTEENKANLVLAAAAPDLLEALISCKNAMEHGDPNEETTRQVWDRIIFNAHAAITKALGEETDNG